MDWVKQKKKKKKRRIFKPRYFYYLNPTIHIRVINDSNTNSNSCCPANPVIPISPDRSVVRKYTVSFYDPYLTLSRSYMGFKRSRQGTICYCTWKGKQGPSLPLGNILSEVNDSIMMPSELFINSKWPSLLYRYYNIRSRSNEIFFLFLLCFTNC